MLKQLDIDCHCGFYSFCVTSAHEQTFSATNSPTSSGQKQHRHGPRRITSEHARPGVSVLLFGLESLGWEARGVKGVRARGNVFLVEARATETSPSSAAFSFFFPSPPGCERVTFDVRERHPPNGSLHWRSDPLRPSSFLVVLC